MSARLYGIEITVPVVATSLFDILESSYSTPSPASFWVGEFAIRAGKDNTGIIYWGASNVTTLANRWGYIQAAESFAVSTTLQQFDPVQLFVIGTNAEDILHITSLEY